MSDEFFMREAIRAASQKGTDPALSPIDSVVVLKGKIRDACRN
jgi:tRNA(Arg) A34 adenosine deaminase TadA